LEKKERKKTKPRRRLSLPSILGKTGQRRKTPSSHKGRRGSVDSFEPGERGKSVLRKIIGRKDAPNLIQNGKRKKGKKKSNHLKFLGANKEKKISLITTTRKKSASS